MSDVDGRFVCVGAEVNDDSASSTAETYGAILVSTAVFRSRLAKMRLVSFLFELCLTSGMLGDNLFLGLLLLELFVIAIERKNTSVSPLC